jgi:hypothetical protein
MYDIVYMYMYMYDIVYMYMYMYDIVYMYNVMYDNVTLSTVMSFLIVFFYNIIVGEKFFHVQFER